MKLKAFVVASWVIAAVSINAGCASTTPSPPAPEFAHTFSAWAGQEIVFAGYWQKLGSRPSDLSGPGGTFVATDEAIYVFVRPKPLLIGTRYIEPTQANLTDTWAYSDIVELRKQRWPGKAIELRHRDGAAFWFWPAPVSYFGVSAPAVVGNTPVEDAIEMMKYRTLRDGGST